MDLAWGEEVRRERAIWGCWAPWPVKMRRVLGEGDWRGRMMGFGDCESGGLEGELGVGERREMVVDREGRREGRDVAGRVVLNWRWERRARVWERSGREMFGLEVR